VGETVLLIGALGKLPYGGMAFYWGHHIVGLRELGYDVHYLERLDHPNEAYDPNTNEMTDDPSYALGYLAGLLPRFGVGPERTSFVDRAGVCHFSGWPALRDALDRAAFVLNVGVPTWFDELERCERRLFIDCDPMFTQVAMVTGDGTRAEPPRHYDTLFTSGARIGADDCLIPTAGREWLPARNVVSTSLWKVTPAPPDGPVVALLHWAAGGELEFEGHTFGHKDREFVRFLELPRRTARRLVAAVGGGGAPKDELGAAGWELVGPLQATRTIDVYQRFIADSRADLGIAKHAYVETRSGWFSDRSTCYLAAGRPVLHQDTGFTDWLPEDEGVLAFSDLDSLVDALDRLDADYDRHAHAARRIVEEHFEARVVLHDMLEQAGIA
jgi:hypothetical protein